MKKSMTKVFKARLVLVMMMFFMGVATMFMTMPMSVQAGNEEVKEEDGGGKGNIEEEKIFTGTKKLLTDLTGALVGLEAVICGGLIVKEFIVMQQADEQEKPRHKKNIKSILISGVIVMCVTGLIDVIFAYYK